MTLGEFAQLAGVGLVVAAVPLSFVFMRGNQDRYRKLVWITAFLTFDLILFGAFTRLTDSGLGCPDWPGCYGFASPIDASAQIRAAQDAMPHGPVTFKKAWIEMLHRYFAMGVGALITVMMIFAWMKRRELRFSPWAPTALFVLVCVQGAFGAWTVTLKLMPIIVTLHLMLGIGLLCALGMLASHVAARTARAEEALPSTVSSRFASVAPWLLLLVFMQIALGGWVSTNYAVLACPDFPLCHGKVVPDADYARGFQLFRELGRQPDGSLLPLNALVAIHFVHRLFAIVIFVALGWFGMALARACKAAGAARAPERRLARILQWVLLVQLITGISNVVFAWPLVVAVLHNGGAALMALIMAVLMMRLKSSARAGTLA